MKVSIRLQAKLFNWYEENKRNLPWRQTKDPYKIWISEVMLQQTTSKAVIPYYKNFLKKFPKLSDLAKADKKEVFRVWAGLGYYRRAENLIKSAQILSQTKSFPKSYKELLKLPGFGDYTSRSLSSLAFEEPVGVLDGNVIRFLSRFYNLPIEHWRTEERKKLQNLSNLWVQNQKASSMNQALMELGALVCIKARPLCLLCPLTTACLAFQHKTQQQLPLKKEKKATEFWFYHPERRVFKNKWFFVKNESLPFLKGAWILPGKSRKLSGEESQEWIKNQSLKKNIQKISKEALKKSPTKNYDFIHTITNYKIFVKVCDKKTSLSKSKEGQFLSFEEVQSLNPSSLIKKILKGDVT